MARQDLESTGSVLAPQRLDTPQAGLEERVGRGQVDGVNVQGIKLAAIRDKRKGAGRMSNCSTVEEFLY